MSDATDILTDVSNDSMACAVEQNLIDFWGLLANSPLVEVQKTSEMLRYISGVSFPLMNGVVGARFTDGDIDLKIDDALHPITDRSLPMMWWIGPSSQPTNLGERLARRGLVAGDAAPGMAIDLSEMSEVLAPGGMRVEVVAETDLETYANVLTLGFGMPQFVGKSLVDIIGSVASANAPWRLYLGYLGGQPVATSMVVFAAGVAGIYNVATVPRARGRGVGRAMTVAELRDAREAGYRIGILQSSAMGHPVYARIGFRDYCEIKQYIWMPGAAPVP